MARGMARALRCPTLGPHVGARMGYPYAMRWLGAAGGLPPLRVFVPRVPMLYAYAERKPVMFHSRTWAARMAAAPGSLVLAFPCGHWIMVERAPQFNAALIEWLAA